MIQQYKIFDITDVTIISSHPSLFIQINDYSISVLTNVKLINDNTSSMEYGIIILKHSTCQLINVEISGNIKYPIYNAQFSFFRIEGNFICNVTCTIFLYNGFYAYLFIPATFSGSVIGKKYHVSNYSFMDLVGKVPTTVPGTAAGTSVNNSIVQ